MPRMGGGLLDRWQEVGCGKYCFECPPTPEQARLALFRCDEVVAVDDLGDNSRGGLRALAQRPDLLRLFRSPNPGLAGAGDFGPDPTSVVGQDWTVTEHDRALLAEYESWLPPKVFDAHAHLWNFDYWTDQIATKAGWVSSFGEKSDGTVDSFIERSNVFAPGRTIGGLVLNTPNLAADTWGHSAWSAEECRRASSQGSFFGCAMGVTTETSFSDIERGVRQFGFVGLKCYHFFAKGMDNTQDSDINQYLTDEHCRAAQAFNLTVSLHMVKPMACSDPENLANIRRLCTAFPGMKLILCHSARGFNMHTVINSIAKLADLDNLYFDTGAVTEAGATNAILRTFGPRKVMFGSDWPVSEGRGKCISLGDSFIWITPHNIDLVARYTDAGMVCPALVGFETLRALKQACDELSLTRADIEDIFWNNAVRLYGKQHAAFLEKHPDPLDVPPPSFEQPLAFFEANVVDQTYGAKPSEKSAQRL